MNNNWQGRYKEHSHFSRKNLINLFIFVIALLPAIWIVCFSFNINKNCILSVGEKEKIGLMEI